MKSSLTFRILSTLAKKRKEENNESLKKFDCGHASEVGTRQGEIGLKFINKEFFTE